MENVATETENYPKIGNYEFLSVLGRGGMGIVCKYRSATLNKFAAVKMITNKELSEVAMVRFQREGQAAARLQHSGIVGIHDLGVTEHGEPYMIMDYFEGETVDELLSRKYQFSIRQLETIFLQCAEAMQHAHSQNVLHRDLKPSNIMVTNLKSDQILIKILDFGIAKILDDDGEFTTTTGMNIGSPLYMSPEQSQGSPIDARADIYSLGCVFYAILVGEPPFKGKNSLDLSLQHQKEKPLAIAQIPHLKHLSAMGETIMKMLEKDPLKRQQSMREVCDMLRRGSSMSAKRVSDKILVSRTAAIAVLAGVAVSVFAGTKLLDSRTESVAVASTSQPGLRPSALKLQEPDILNSPKTRDSLELFSQVQVGKDSIDFSGRPLGDASLNVLQNARRVVSLSLAGSDIGDAGVKIIGDLPLLKNLNISNNLRVTDEGMKHLQHLHRLRGLDVSVTKITDEGMVSLGKISDLDSLDLAQTGITDSGVGKIQTLKKLDRLNLSKTAVTDEMLRFLPSWPKLKTLVLAHDNIRDKGIATIVKCCPQLENLQLSATACTPKSAPMIARLKNLKTLDIPSGYDDKSVEFISHLPKLESLKLTSRNTDAVFAYLANAKNLHKLVLRGKMQTRTPTAEAFEKNHPECKLERESEMGGGSVILQVEDMKSMSAPRY